LGNFTGSDEDRIEIRDHRDQAGSRSDILVLLVVPVPVRWPLLTVDTP
jgi:hypothetical protein